MSKVNGLIKKLCPNGVEYKKLDSLLDYIQPTKYIVKNTNYCNNYKTPVLTAGQTFILGYTNEENGIYIANKNSPVIIFDDFMATNHWVDFNFKVKSSAMKILVPKTNDNFKYIYYCINNINYIPKEHSRQWIQNYSQFTIPVPPIEIQEEIVRILDKFGQLEAELEAELEARKRQYEFWRGKLFDTTNAKYKTIKKLCKDIIVPMRDKPKVFDGSIPWCRIEDKEGNYFNTSKSGQYVSEDTVKKMNLKVFPTGTVICSCSASIGSYAINTQPLITNQTFIGLVCGDEIINKYLFYFMQTQTSHLLELSNAGTIPYISRKKFEDLEVPIPSIEEQERIVSILDKFDKLINDISVGLPAEMELRRKQYEYYRNKLLSFEELENE